MGSMFAENIAYLPDGSTLIWPVPGYRGISRWMIGSSGQIHGGVDIRAAAGTEISWLQPVGDW